MVNDHISDFIARIRNGYGARRETISAPAVKNVQNLADALVKAGYLKSIEKKDKELVITLKYVGREPAIMGLKRVSKPGARVYTGVKELPRVWGGLGMNILSTPKGIVSDKLAKKLGCGGELLAQVW